MCNHTVLSEKRLNAMNNEEKRQLDGYLPLSQTLPESHSPSPPKYTIYIYIYICIDIKDNIIIIIILYIYIYACIYIYISSTLQSQSPAFDAKLCLDLRLAAASRTARAVVIPY